MKQSEQKFFYSQARRYEDVRKQERELLETQSIPIRNYLMNHVMTTLTKGLIECCEVRPDDPVDFLVGFLGRFLSNTKSFRD